MTAADGIRRLGFRRWYEKQLIESHAFLVTGFLSMIAMLAFLEEFSLRSPGLTLLATSALIAACGMVCAWSLRRYHAVLMRAEHVGEHSTCGRCTAYGALEIVDSGRSASGPDPEAPPWLKVRCRKCGHQWMID